MLSDIQTCSTTDGAQKRLAAAPGGTGAEASCNILSWVAAQNTSEARYDIILRTVGKRRTEITQGWRRGSRKEEQGVEDTTQGTRLDTYSCFGLRR